MFHYPRVPELSASISSGNPLEKHNQNTLGRGKAIRSYKEQWKPLRRQETILAVTNGR